MNKKNDIITMLINLAKFVFSEVDFNRFISYIKLKLYTNMRLFVEQRLEYLETKYVLQRENAVLEAQIDKCRRLDAAVTDLCIDSLVSSP